MHRFCRVVEQGVPSGSELLLLRVRCCVERRVFMPRQVRRYICVCAISDYRCFASNSPKMDSRRADYALGAGFMARECIGHRRIRSAWILRLIERMVKFIYRGTDRILVQSEAFRPLIERLGVSMERITYFPNSAEELYRPVTLPPDAAERALVPAGFCVMYAGNIGAAQSFETILSAAERLRLYPDIHWVVLGDGRMASWVRAQIVERGLSGTVLMLGRHPLESMPRFFPRRCHAGDIEERADSGAYDSGSGAVIFGLREAYHCRNKWRGRAGCQRSWSWSDGGRGRCEWVGRGGFADVQDAKAATRGNGYARQRLFSEAFREDVVAGSIRGMDEGIS